MRTRPIETKSDLDKAIRDLPAMVDYLPFVMTITQGKSLRTEAQNSRYWASITEFMNQIAESIARVTDTTGYTDIEVRRLIADEMTWEQSCILLARKSEVVHEVLKAICNIPTSTRLGTKEFMRYEDILAATMSEIIGIVNGFERKI